MKSINIYLLFLAVILSCCGSNEDNPNSPEMKRMNRLSSLLTSPLSTAPYGPIRFVF